MELIIKEEAKNYLRDSIYNQAKKEFRKNVLNTELTALLNNGVDGYGLSKLQGLWNRCNAVGAPPELQRLKPVISEIVDFSGPNPVLKNPEKLREFSSEVITDILKVVAYKDPKLLESRFTQDEQAMAKLKGDILPDLIMSAHKDTSLKAEIEKGFGEKLTKKSLGEILKGAKWADILKWLLILGGLATAIGLVGVLT